MRRRILDLVLVAGLAFGFASAASAQAPLAYNPAPLTNFYTRPTLSPYLNLLRGGDAAANYYLGVVPEVDRRNQQAFVNNSLLDLSQSTGRSPYAQYLDDGSEFDVPFRQLPATGHPSGFMIYNAYYNNLPQRGFIPYNPNRGYNMGNQQLLMQQLPMQPPPMQR